MGLRSALRSRVERIVSELMMTEWFASSMAHRLASTHVVWGPPERVAVHHSVRLNNAVLNSASGSIDLKEGVFCGHNVMILAAGHDPDVAGIERHDWQTQGRDITIERFAWLGSGSIILGPCRIGEGAVVAAGSVVRNDVAPHSLVGGVPARVIRKVGPTES